MSIEYYANKVTEFRRKHPNCDYCISNKYYNIIGHVAECTARQICCWNSEKTAKKCDLYSPRFFLESEYL